MIEPAASRREPKLLRAAEVANRGLRHAGLVFAPLLAAGIFVLDTLSPLHFAVAVLYVVVVVAAATVYGRGGVLFAAFGCGALTILSFLIAHGSRIEGTAPLRLLVSLAAIVVTTILVLRIQRTSANLRSSERKRVNLSRHFSSQLIGQLAESDVPLSVARCQPAAVMFVDMVGFTAYSARLPPLVVIDFLREFLALLSKSVFAHHGVIDKFLGDGLMAVFGSPIGSPQDATNAARCALNILQSVDRWNEARRRAGHPAIQVAVGIHAGDVVFGDVGSQARLELTVLGDAVNVASRVEAYSRVLSAQILATAAFIEAVRAEGGDEIVQPFLDQGWHMLRGHDDPVRLYGVARGGDMALSDARACAANLASSARAA